MEGLLSTGPTPSSFFLFLHNRFNISGKRLLFHYKKNPMLFSLNWPLSKYSLQVTMSICLSVVTCDSCLWIYEFFINATIRTIWEIQCPLYTGFFYCALIHWSRSTQGKTKELLIVEVVRLHGCRIFWRICTFFFLLNVKQERQALFYDFAQLRTIPLRKIVSLKILLHKRVHF